ncbi:MAG: glycoside hydrolase family 95 protein [Tenuifilaceae bacterium]|jgi:alpha-L-fucosidase 2|nr:glycoside hydrolase family 95 protein [Tenuifilaceae bacterium]
MKTVEFNSWYQIAQIMVFIWVATLIVSCSNQTKNEANQLKLWFDCPAQDWMREGLPIGNGFMGVMFMGNPDREQLQFSEESLWAGGPNSGTQYNFGLKQGAYTHLSKIRNFLLSGETQKAFNLSEKWMTGIINPRDNADFGDYGAHQTMGDIFVSVENTGYIKDYRRELDLNTGIGSVSYADGNILHHRTFFGCYPHRAMVYNFENSAKEGVNYILKIDTPHNIDSLVFVDSALHLYGHLADNELKFITSLILDTDGTISYQKNFLQVIGAKNLTIKHLAFTAYSPQFPHYRNNGFLSKATAAHEKAKNIGFQQLKEEHIADYKSLIQRVSLNISGPSHDSIPLNRRMDQYSKGVNDVGLEQLYFQYARYLTISASRPGTLPMNLQGKWNNSTRPPWACDYHTNINLQMLYWPTEVTNLSECHLPLMGFMQSLILPGQMAAKEFFGARGWIVNTMCNAYGYTSPGWGLPWGFFPAGAAWLSRHAWEHFEFTQDTAFLRESAFPIMEDAALFWKDYLTMNNNGFLVSAPSFSPEHGGISLGASMDHQIAWDLFNSCAKAANILKKHNEKDQFMKFRDLISPPQIGRWGQLQEWIEDVDDPHSTHRHVSHLYALHPGQQISPIKTPELASAALTSLNARGKGGTGWSLAWKINFFARLHKGDEAYDLLRRLLNPVKTTYVSTTEGGSYNNLLCAHPPFQLDGNMGGAAGMAEMLLQSHEGFIHFLPAIPKKWAKGSVAGLKARGNFEVDFTWENEEVKRGIIKGKPGSKGFYSVGEKKFAFTIPASGKFRF